MRMSGISLWVGALLVCGCGGGGEDLRAAEGEPEPSAAADDTAVSAVPR